MIVDRCETLRKREEGGREGERERGREREGERRERMRQIACLTVL